jgi:hypothetical protein
MGQKAPRPESNWKSNTTMPTKKQPKPKAPLITSEVLPVVIDRDPDSELTGSMRFTTGGRPYHLTMTLSVTDDLEQAELWSRPILWKHQESDLNPRRYDGPQRVTGWFCPAHFVLRGAGSRIEFTLDLPDIWRRIADEQPLTYEQQKQMKSGQPMPDPIPEITVIRNLNRSDGIRSPIEFPATFPSPKLVTEKALRLALVVARATPPGLDNDSGKWRYQITEYCRGTIDDVPMRSRFHHHPAMSAEGLRQVLELFDESKRGSKERGNGAKAEYERIAREIDRSPFTVREMVNELYRQGLLPRKDRK